MVSVLISPPAHAIIVLRDPGRNLTPPTGALSGSGWQYEGEWHGFTGTPIGPHHFITAAHVGGFPLSPFYYQGHRYPALEKNVLPGTDIAIWRVAGTFSRWAPLYTGDDEVGRQIVLFGRGGPRGPLIHEHGHDCGYWWTSGDGQLSWGSNRVIATTINLAPGKALGPLLLFCFDPDKSDSGLDTAAVSGGDSGGGVFLNDGGVWKVAGVTYGVDRGYALGPTGMNELAASLFDARGLYRTSPQGRFFLDDRSPERFATTCIVSRLSSHRSEIQAILNTPPHVPRWLWVVGAVAIATLFPSAFALWSALRARRRYRQQNTALPATAEATPAFHGGDRLP